MFPQFFSCLVLSSAFAFLTLPSAAQDDVILQFLSFPMAGETKPIELLLGEGKSEKVNIPTTEISPSYKVKRQAVWAVGETVTGEDGKSTFAVYGKAPALATAKQLILLVRKGKTDAEGFEVIPIANDVANFGASKFLFMNASKVDIAGEAGGEKFAIKPGAHIIVKPKPGDNGRTFHAMFYFRREDEARPFFSSKWPISEVSRGLIFFYHDPASNRLRLHSIRDFF